MKEAVVYILLDENHVLIEHRLANGKQPARGIMVPGGGIEDTDDTEGTDYREQAVRREIAEELGVHIVLKEYVYLDHIIRTETGTPFHVFLVLDWEGEIPEYIMEDGKKDGKLEWMEIEEVLRKTKNQVTVSCLERVKEYLQG